jgi:small-conductance mechanosensitive channel
LLDSIKAVIETNFNLKNLLFLAVNVIFIAIVFEALAWWLGRRVERMTAPLMTADSRREPAWRVRRRTVLRHTPKIITRTFCYAIALMLILNAFSASGISLLAFPILPMAIAIGVVFLIFGAALLPILRDLVQGYTILAEDALAVGDVVQINGHGGTVERFSLRGVQLRDAKDRLHFLSNREISRIVAHQRHEEETESTPRPAFDPLDER